MRVSRTENLWRVPGLTKAVCKSLITYHMNVREADWRRRVEQAIRLHILDEDYAILQNEFHENCRMTRKRARLLSRKIIGMSTENIVLWFKQRIDFIKTDLLQDYLKSRVANITMEQLLSDTAPSSASSCCSGANGSFSKFSPVRSCLHDPETTDPATCCSPPYDHHLKHSSDVETGSQNNGSSASPTSSSISTSSSVKGVCPLDEEGSLATAAAFSQGCLSYDPHEYIELWQAYYAFRGQCLPPGRVMSLGDAQLVKPLVHHQKFSPNCSYHHTHTHTRSFAS